MKNHFILQNGSKKALVIFLAVIISISVFTGINPFNSLANASETFSSVVVYSSDFSQDDVSTWKLANTTNIIADEKISLKSSAADAHSSVAIRPEESNTQFVRAVFNTADFSNSRPVVWARASYLEAGKNESLTGYYLAFEGDNPVLYKREKFGDTYKDTCLTYCGRITWDNDKEYTLEIDVTGIEDATVINVRVYKSASLYLQARQTFVDSTNPIVKGGAGISLKASAADAAGKFDKFDYYSTDGVKEYYRAYENGKKTGVSFAQSVAINKDTEYTLSVEIDEADAYEPLVISYATTGATTGSHILAQIKDCVVNEVNGKNVYSYTFKLADQGGTIYYNYDYRSAGDTFRTTPVFIGFRQSDATIKNKYSKFTLCEKKSDGSFGPNLLVNGDFKLGLYGWSDELDVAFNHSGGYSLFGEVTSKNSSRVQLEGPFVDKEVNLNYTVTTTSGTTSDTYDTSKNLIYNKKSTTFPTNFAGFTDGLNTKVTVGGSQTKWPLKFTYQLDSTYKIDKVRVTSDATGYGNGKLRLGEYAIYVSDNADDLYSSENLIATVVGEISNAGTNQTVIDTIEFLETYDTTGSYFGLLVNTPSLITDTTNGEYNQAFIYEIEVEGTRPASVTATAGVGGTISPEGETVLNGTPVEYTVTANEGYKVDKVLVNGEAVALTDGKYTFTGNEEGSNTIEVTFALIGDTNNDGYLDDDDLDVIKKHILRIETADLAYADLDGDGDIDLLDLVTAYELQQGISPAVASLKATLGLNDSEYTAAINRAAAFNTSATATDRLNAVFKKAQNGQPITIAAIGGSITEGAGHDEMSGVSVSAKDLGVTVNGDTYENSKYVDRVVNWFDTTFESSAVTKVNAGFGGTPSFLGTFRLEHDVLKYNPDLVIVEFSVNDLGNYQLDEGYMLDAYESVIRKSLESGAAVVAVFTVNNLYDNIGNSWQNYHKLIADHYNIPTISYHNAIYPNNEWITEWTKLSGDNVHPNVAGHALLANCITSYFEDVYEMDSHTATKIPATWYHKDTFANTEILYFDNAEFNGMTKTASNKYGYIAKNAEGTGNESIKVKVPAGAKEIYVFYNTITNAGSIYTKLGDSAESGPFSTNVSSISYSHGEWTRIYNGEALNEDTDLTIRSDNDGKPLEILTVLVLK